jgi:hypothetical protein
MSGNNVRALVAEFFGKEDGPNRPRLHIQTVKISEYAHADLRALAQLSERSKTALASDLLMAAIKDAFEALPNDALDDDTVKKILGIKAASGDWRHDLKGMRDVAREFSRIFFDQDQDDYAAGLGSVDLVDSEPVNQNGAHK